MRMCLVGADFEENLGVGMIAAAAHAAGHAVTTRPFNLPGELDGIADAIARDGPDVVGLSMQFQHRGHEFLALTRALRKRGYQGHVTCGGQFPTLAWREVLGPRTGIDSVVLHEGERTIVELLSALGAGRDLATVPGVALRDGAGEALRTAPRRLEDNLDSLPFALRYRPHSRHMGVPFVPIMGGRGCWGACAYCSITSFYRDARGYGGGRTLRLRSPENIAEEIALLWHAAGAEGIYCFHDDDFLLPRPEDSLLRVRAIRAALDGLGVGRIGLIGKCRPDCLTEELARELRSLGVLRLYVGVENTARGGSAHLRREAQRPHIDSALAACRSANIFVCYNLLIFEPDATLTDVRENARFMREHPDHPMNFCRAEPYHGTPMQLDLAGHSRLSGSWLGWDYRIRDPRTELLFRVCSAAFRQRNFDTAGVANRYLGLGYSLKLLEHFYDDPAGRRPALARRVRELTRSIALDTVDRLDEAIELAETVDLADTDEVERRTALLGLRVAEGDAVWHAALDELYSDLSAFGVEARRPRPRLQPPRRVRQLAQKVALGTSLAAWAAGVSGCASTVVSDPVPTDAGRADGDGGGRDVVPDYLVTDAVPYDAGRDAVVVDPPPRDAGRDVMPDYLVVDIAPYDAGRDISGPWDPLPPDAGRDGAVVVDPPPPDAGRDAPMVADPPPPDAGRDAPMVVDPPPPDAGRDTGPLGLLGPVRSLPLIDQWRDTAPRSRRSNDLPLWAPPEVALVSERVGDSVRVSLTGAGRMLSTRWCAKGEVKGDGTEVCWIPASPDDQLRVAVRTPGGVAVVALRASQVGPELAFVAEIREGGAVPKS